jgi:hypothetical protein
MPCAYCNAQNQCLSAGNMRGEVSAVGGRRCTGARIHSVAGSCLCTCLVFSECCGGSLGGLMLVDDAHVCVLDA